MKFVISIDVELEDSQTSSPNEIRTQLLLKAGKFANRQLKCLTTIDGAAITAWEVDAQRVD